MLTADWFVGAVPLAPFPLSLAHPMSWAAMGIRPLPPVCPQLALPAGSRPWSHTSRSAVCTPLLSADPSLSLTGLLAPSRAAPSFLL